jgi:hypothetical protein
MKCKISDTSYVMNFMDTEGSSDKIIHLIENKFNDILSFNKYEGLEGWQIYYKIIYNNVRSILIYKGGTSYPNEKYKEIVIHIPIPAISKVAWGVYENQYIQDIAHLDKKMKSFESIDVVFENFATMEDYLVDSISKAVEYTLKTGFTVSGQRIKIL